MGDGCVEAEQLLDGRGDLRRGHAELGELDRVAKESDDAVADEAGGRVVAGDDELEDRREQFLVVEPLVAVAGADQPADEIVAGGDLLGRDQRLEHADDGIGGLLGRRVLGRGRRRHEQLGELPPEWSPVGVRDPEELADDGEGQGERIGGDEVDPAVGSLGGDVVEEVVGDRLDTWARNDSTRRGRRRRTRAAAAGCGRAGPP